MNEEFEHDGVNLPTEAPAPEEPAAETPVMATPAPEASVAAKSPYTGEVFKSRYAYAQQQSPYNMPAVQAQQVQPQQVQPQYQPQYSQQQQPPPIIEQQYQTLSPLLQEGSTAAKAKSGTAAIVVALIIVLVLMAGVTVFYLIQGGDIELPKINDRPGISRPADGNAPVIELPTQPKPPVEEKYKEADGRYTSQGIVKVVAPSVVGVVTYQRGQNLIPYSEGTGFIISTDGYILTCAHIFEDSARQKVILDDDTEYVATMIGKDIKSDIAVLKIDPAGDKLQSVTLGDSSELELGEPVIAIGNAGGFSNSISGGMVSGLDRKIRSSDVMLEMNCIQTDAAVNPGNSGGPLVNMFGQVVGVVSSKYVPSLDYENIGFAITINDALPIIKDIISKGYVTGRARVGIVYRALDDVTAKALGVEAGLYIDSVDPFCDIANTELRPGDIITMMNGKRVYDADSVTSVVEGLKPGDTVTAHVYRKDIIDTPTEFDITFKLMEDDTLG